MTLDARALWDEVQGNLTKLTACPRHRFGGTYRLGERKVCERCGGSMTLTAIGEYIRGFKAAGGSVDEIWPEWEKPRVPVPAL